MDDLKEKVAIVTGASRGIGRAIAESFVKEGARVIICGRKKESLEEAAHTIGPNATPIVCHVGRLDQLESMVEATKHKFGHIDILVNNAGTNVAQRPCLDFDEVQFDKMIEINLKSVFRLVKLVAPGMCQRRSGSIVNIASISGLRPQFEGMLYSMTKAALIMMTQSLALELGPRGVRVNAVAPGLIQTSLSEYFWKDAGQSSAIFRKRPLARIGQPNEIAGIALLLASDKGSYITGQTIVADGGFLLPAL